MVVLVGAVVEGVVVVVVGNDVVETVVTEEGAELGIVVVVRGDVVYYINIYNHCADYCIYRQNHICDINVNVPNDSAFVRNLALNNAVAHKHYNDTFEHRTNKHHNPAFYNCHNAKFSSFFGDHGPNNNAIVNNHHNCIHEHRINKYHNVAFYNYDNAKFSAIFGDYGLNNIVAHDYCSDFHEHCPNKHHNVAFYNCDNSKFSSFFGDHGPNNNAIVNNHHNCIHEHRISKHHHTVRIRLTQC
ncbi:hypothetical protein COOONC_03896 [Cooperia oncophora]